MCPRLGVHVGDGNVGWRRLRAAVVRLVTSGCVIASGVAGFAADAAPAVVRCVGYDGCNVAPYSNHGYDATTNHTSYWGQYAGDNCTNYVAFLMVTVNGMPDRQPWSGTGDADRWGVAEAGITDSTPAVGAVAWWPARFHGAGRLGHVAYVERVKRNGAIVVSEDSYPDDGVPDYSGDAYDWRTLTRGHGGWPRGFIHFPGSERRPTPAAG